MLVAAHRGLVKTTTGVALLVAVATAVTIPGVYFFAAYKSEQRQINLEAEQTARTLGKFVYTHPDHWRWQSHRLDELLSYGAAYLRDSHRRIVSDDGDLIAAFGTSPGYPSLSGIFRVSNGADVVGFVEISYSLWPLIRQTLFVSAIGVLLSTAVYLTLRSLPLRALNRVLADFETSRTELQTANASITSLNDELEQRVIARTAELKAAQEELLRTERLSALGQVTATVAHELRNPLGAIRNSVFLVGEKTQHRGLGLERMLARTERNISRCDRIVNELLDYTRKKTLTARPTPLDAWLADVLAEQTVPEGIALCEELGTPGLELAFDADRLRRAVINVFDNACQAMAEWHEREPGRDALSLTVQTRSSGGRAELRFIDTGPGMTPELLEKAFEPLFSTKGFGVGLGMPTIKQIMEQHGGGMDVSSEPGRGTTVVLWLPVENQQEEAA